MIRAAIKNGDLSDDGNIGHLLTQLIKLKVCSKSEANAYKEAELARNYAIQVDDSRGGYFEGRE